MSVLSYPDGCLFPGPNSSDVSPFYVLEGSAQSGSLAISGTGPTTKSFAWVSPPEIPRMEYHDSNNWYIRFDITITSGRASFDWTALFVDSAGGSGSQWGFRSFPSVTSSGVYSQNVAVTGAAIRFPRVTDRYKLQLDVRIPFFVTFNATLNYGGVLSTALIPFLDQRRNLWFKNRRDGDLFQKPGPRTVGHRGR